MRKLLFLFGQFERRHRVDAHRGIKRFVPTGGALIQQGDRVDAVFILLERVLAVWLKGPPYRSSH